MNRDFFGQKVRTTLIPSFPRSRTKVSLSFKAPVSPSTALSALVSAPSRYAVEDCFAWARAGQLRRVNEGRDPISLGPGLPVIGWFNLTKLEEVGSLLKKNRFRDL